MSLDDDRNRCVVAVVTAVRAGGTHGEREAVVAVVVGVVVAAFVGLAIAIVIDVVASLGRVRIHRTAGVIAVR